MNGFCFFLLVSTSVALSKIDIVAFCHVSLCNVDLYSVCTGVNMKLKGGKMAKYVTVGHVVHCKHETCLRENTTQNHKTSSSVSHYCLFDSVDI